MLSPGSYSVGFYISSFYFVSWNISDKTRNLPLIDRLVLIVQILLVGKLRASVTPSSGRFVSSLIKALMKNVSHSVLPWVELIVIILVKTRSLYSGRYTHEIFHWGSLCGGTTTSVSWGDLWISMIMSLSLELSLLESQRMTLSYLLGLPLNI